jgi:hypothetical protein
MRSMASQTYLEGVLHETYLFTESGVADVVRIPFSGEIFAEIRLRCEIAKRSELISCS